MPKEPILLSWSGGKDSALALHAIQASNRYEVVALLTVCTEGFRRIQTHGVRCSLLKEQAASLRLPLRKIFVPRECSNDEYETQVKRALLEYKEKDVSNVVFGDLFLEEISRYREQMLAALGMTALYPLWGKETTKLAQQFIDAGFKAALVCVNSKLLDKRFAGRMFDQKLLAELPSFVDPCGENGEFHTFVFDGPCFSSPISIRTGSVLQKDSFYYAELLPAKSQQKKKANPKS